MTRHRLTAGERAHAEHFVRTKERERPAEVSEETVERILADMESDDETTRARAVREICPCRMPWEVFERLRRAAKRLQHDPSPQVAANARHIEEDARTVAAHEAAFELGQERESAADKNRRSLRGRRKRRD